MSNDLDVAVREISRLMMDLEDARKRIRELESFRFAVAEKTGVIHAADGHAPHAGPDDAILASVASGVDSLKKEAEFAHHRHAIRELDAEIAQLKSAFEQACEVAEECQAYVDEYTRKKHNVDDDLLVMRANLERLLK